jgi:hypothetical protein
MMVAVWVRSSFSLVFVDVMFEVTTSGTDMGSNLDRLARKFSHDHVLQRNKHKRNKVKDYTKYEGIERKGHQAAKDMSGKW